MESTELTTVESNLPEIRDPSLVLAEAHKAAVALQRVIDSKKKKVVINGEVYLEYEDWTTLGKFYGITVGTMRPEKIENGWMAGAEARLVSTGQVISAAWSSCTRDEALWKDRTDPQIMSMAQTRACAKALRNVLSWVAVLAGYRPTPAEEMEGIVSRTVESPPVPMEHIEPNGPVKIVDVRLKQGEKNGKLWTRYGVIDELGNELSTFDHELATAAKKYKESGVPVELVMEKKGKFLNLLEIRIPDENVPA